MYLLAGISYRSKAVIAARVRELRATNSSTFEGEDKLFLLAVLSHHRNFDEKRGPGVRDVISTDNGSPCFGLRRKDGRVVHISWMKALKAIPVREDPERSRLIQKKAQHSAALLEAAERAVRPTLAAFRLAEGVSNQTQVIQDPPVDTLFAAFLENSGVKRIYNVRLVSKPGVRILSFEDEGFKAAWVAHHGTTARLSVRREENAA